MPFGNSCEFMDMDACLAKHKSMGHSEEESRAMCGTLMRDTEEKCRQQNAEETYAALLGEVDPQVLLQANSEVGMEIVAAARIGWNEIQAAEGAEKIPTFEMLAYTGARMRIEGFHHEVVVDLSGVKVSGKTIPIYRQHDPLMIVGHGTAEVSGSDIRIKGLVSADNEHARDVVSSAKRGFPWQSSIGAGIGKIEFVKPGEKSSVNGRVETGPLLIARQTLLSETSFVPRGADRKTSAKVAASSLTLARLHSLRAAPTKPATLAALHSRRNA